jgi:hypothetical protein
MTGVASTVRSKPRATRQPMFRTGVLITSGGGRQTVAIKNLSDTGARIEYHTRTELPPVVMLAEPTLKLMKKARVVWQGEGVAGLEFIPD